MSSLKVISPACLVVLQISSFGSGNFLFCSSACGQQCHGTFYANTLFLLLLQKKRRRKHVNHCIRNMGTILYTYKPQANEQQHLQQKSEVRMRSIPVAGATLFGPRATTLKSIVKKSREIRNCSLMLDKSNRPIPIFAGLWEI